MTNNAGVITRNALKCGRLVCRNRRLEIAETKLKRGRRTPLLLQDIGLVWNSCSEEMNLLMAN